MGSSRQSNGRLFEAVVSVWLEKGVEIPNEDIPSVERLVSNWLKRGVSFHLNAVMYLIEGLPNTNATLAKIIKSSSSLPIQDLPEEVALNWLEKTASDDLRKEYRLGQEKDLLFEKLIDVENPTEDYVRYLIIDDPGGYLSDTMDWDHHVKYITNIYKKRWKNLFQGSFIEAYLELVGHFGDISRNKGRNRKYLYRMVDLKDGDNLDNSDLVRTLKGFLLYWKTEPDEIIRQKASIAMKHYLQMPNVVNAVKRIEPLRENLKPFAEEYEIEINL